MPRKPNYRFERSERTRLKAAKKAERLAARQERAEARKEQAAADAEEASPSPDTPED